MKTWATDRILFAGNGHGGLAALQSLQTRFPEMEIVSDDPAILANCRPADRVMPSVEASDCDVIVCASHYQILPARIVNQKCVINTHPSLLPKYRGWHSVVWAMLNEEPTLGFTIHLANEGIDDGDILAQFVIEYAGQTSTEILAVFDDYVRLNLGEIVSFYLQGGIEPKPQNRNEATWVCRRNLNDCFIDFSQSNSYLRAFFKALVRPYPLPRIRINNEIFEVPECEIIDRTYVMHTGRVLNIERDAVFIKTAEGFLVIRQLWNVAGPSPDNVVGAAKILKIGQCLA